MNYKGETDRQLILCFCFKLHNTYIIIPKNFKSLSGEKFYILEQLTH